MTDYRNWDNHALRHECLKLSAELEQANKKIESLRSCVSVTREILYTTSLANIDCLGIGRTFEGEQYPLVDEVIHNLSMELSDDARG